MVALLGMTLGHWHLKGGIAMNEDSKRPNRRAARIALTGTTITGILGVIMAINAISSSEYVGAGLLLIAAAIAFGVLAFK